MIETRITFYYAIIDETGWCYEVITTSRNRDGMEGHIAIPSASEAYLEKYYNVADGKWYLEATFETEWTPT